MDKPKRQTFEQLLAGEVATSLINELPPEPPRLG
jgi:hypothetical protein